MSFILKLFLDIKIRLLQSIMLAYTFLLQLVNKTTYVYISKKQKNNWGSENPNIFKLEIPSQFYEQEIPQIFKWLLFLGDFGFIKNNNTKYNYLGFFLIPAAQMVETNTSPEKARLRNTPNARLETEPWTQFI